MKSLSSILLALSGAIALVACTPNELGFIEAQGEGDMSAGPAPRAEFDQDFADSCGSGALTTEGDARIVRTPYLQQVSHASAQVMWTANDIVNPQVTVTAAVGGDPIDASVAIDASARLENAEQLVADISGLEPGTVYCYEIRENGELLQGATGFRTAPEVGSDEPIRFLAFGDLGKQTSDQFVVADSLKTVDIDFGLVAGDIAYGSGTLTAFELYYFDVYSELIDNIPFYPASGNHDYKTERAGPYRQVYSLPQNGSDELYYSFDYGNIHVVIIDTETIDSAQLDWLDADLASTDQKWKVVMGHKPPYSSGYHGSNFKVRDKFNPILATHGVHVAIFGHEHNYERVAPQDGVTYVVSGGGGVGTRPVGTSEFTAYSEQVSHFTYFETKGDELTMWAIDATGKTFDTTVIHAI